MRRRFSLAHLTVIRLPPPQVIEVAARTGYDTVGLASDRRDGNNPCLSADGRQAVDARHEGRNGGDRRSACSISSSSGSRRRSTSRRSSPSRRPGAELNARYMITSAFDPDLSRFTDRLAAVSDLASQYGLRAVLEFFPWTVVPDLSAAVRIVEAAERPALGILVDTLHFNRSASTFDELDRISPSRLPFVHVADAPVQASYTTEELLARRPRGAPAARRGRHRYQAHPEPYASGHPGGAGGSNDRHGCG